MKKLLSVLILSFIALSNTAFAQDFAQEPTFDPDGNTMFKDEFIPLEIEPIPFEPVEPSMEDPYTEDPALEVELDFELLEDGRPRLSWTRYDGPNFMYYKIVHDQDDPNLYYPEFGFIHYYEDQNKTNYIWDEQLPVGENFMRICVITSDDRRGCSNTISHFMPQAFYENLERDREMHMEEPREEIREGVVDKIKDNNINNNNNGRKGILIRWIWENIGIVLAIIAIIIAASGFTFAAKRKAKSISKYMNEIDDTYSEYKMKAKRCEAELYRLKDIVDNELKTGKIDDSAYKLLIHRIENYMVDIQKQIVNEKFGGLPASLKDEMFKMMEDGEITEAEFETMQKLIKRSELSVTEQDSLLQQIRDFKKQDEVMKKRGKN